MQTETPLAPQAEPYSAGRFEVARMSSFILRFVNTLKRAGKSVHTLTAYRNDLSLFSEFLTQTGYRPDDQRLDLRDNWIHFLRGKGRHSDASIRRALMSVRTFLHFLIKEKIIESSLLLESKSPQQPTHDLLTILPNHFKKLLRELKKEALSGDEKSLRDLVIFQVLGKYGLKASEAASLTWGDISRSGQGGAGGHLFVRGSAERMLAFDHEIEKQLNQLKTIREELRLPVDSGAKLFFGYLNLSRQTRTSSLHRHGIKFVVYEVSDRILHLPYNSESLRNHAIAQWIAKGLTREQIADLAGYSSLNSLERFSLDVRKIRLPKRHFSKPATQP